MTWQADEKNGVWRSGRYIVEQYDGNDGRKYVAGFMLNGEWQPITSAGALAMAQESCAKHARD